MAKKAIKISRAHLRAALVNDLASAWKHGRELHPKETPYAFAVYGDEDSIWLSPHILTEESLQQVAREYVEKGSIENIAKAVKDLRFVVPDSPHFDDLVKDFATVDSVIKPFEDKLDESTGHKLVAGEAINALAALDRRGLFGKGKQRSKLLLIILLESEVDWPGLSAKRLNPRTVYRRFQRETKIEGVFATCRTMAVSQNGKSLYLAGSRNESQKSEKSHSELVACDLLRNRLRRRWSFDYPAFGDFAVDLECHGTPEAIFLLRCTHSDGIAETRIHRFAQSQNSVKQTKSLVGWPMAIAISRHDSRVGVAMDDNSVVILDGSLNEIHRSILPQKPYDLLILRNGTILVGTAKGLFSITRNLKVVQSRIRISCHGLVMDESEKCLAISQYFVVDGSIKEKNRPFGVHLISLPSLKQMRTISIPGHQAIMPAISPNGKYIAFEAHEIGTPRKLIGVFQVATGREVTRRRSDQTNAIVFLRNNETLAIANFGFTTSEPVNLWNFLSTSKSRIRSKS